MSPGEGQCDLVLQVSVTLAKGEHDIVGKGIVHYAGTRTGA